MKPFLKHYLITTSVSAMILTTLSAVAQTTTLSDDLILEDRDGITNPENATFFFAEGDPFAGSNALYSWQSAGGAWVWGDYINLFSMFLDNQHVLTLYNTDTTLGSENAAAILLNPGDGALGLVPASITINGDKVITEGNSVTLLEQNFMLATGSSTSLGSPESLLLEGTFGGSGAIPTSGLGTRMMWFPEKAAFRAGQVTGTQWDLANIGDNSTALGKDSTASGDNSTAMSGASARGDNSTAMGNAVATSYSSTALGANNEDRYDATDATTTAAAKTSWQGDDQHSVFEVGIGVDSSNRANALTVLQDGSVEVGKDAADGTVPLQVKADGSIVLAKPQGDISMGIYQ